MKLRRHHNNKGFQQIARGKTAEQLKRIAKKLGLTYGPTKPNRASPPPKKAYNPPKAAG